MQTQQTVVKPQPDGKQVTSSDASVAGESSPGGEKAIRTYTETEYGQMRSSMQAKINEAQKELREIKAAHETLQGDLETAQRRSATLEEEVNEAYSDEKLKAAVLKLRKDKLEFENFKSTFTKEKEEFDRIAKDTARKDQSVLAERLANQFGVDVNALMEFDTPEKMKAYALDNFDASKVVKAEPKEETPKPPEGEKLDKPIIPTATSGGLGDAEFWKAYGQPGFQASPADHKRAMEIKSKATQGG